MKSRAEDENADLGRGDVGREGFETALMNSTMHVLIL